MSIVKCPECGNNISNTAITCPYCGFDVRQKQWSVKNSLCANTSWYLFLGELALGVLVVLYFIHGKKVSEVNFVLASTFGSIFGWVFKLISAAGLVFAISSLIRREPKKILAWACVVFHGVGLL